MHRGLNSRVDSHLSGVDVAAFTALGWETRAVLAALADVRPAGPPRRWHGRLGDGCGCLVVQTGIGLERAAAAARTAPEGAAFAAFGCGGGLVPWLRTGDVVLATAVVRLDTACRPASSLPAVTASPDDLGTHAGPIASTPGVLGTAAEKTAAAGCGALLVDMESWALACEAERRGVPFVAARVVLDVAGDEVPALAGAIDVETGELDRWRAAVALLPRPWTWPAISRLARQQFDAERRLAEVVGRLLRSRADLGVAGPPPVAGA